MKKIYKYEIPIQDKFSILMPDFAKILSVQVQNSHPYIWALIDDKVKLTKRYFRLFATGQEIDCNSVTSPFDWDYCDYVGTFQIMNGLLVWHLFDFYYEDINEQQSDNNTIYSTLASTFNEQMNK